jgi:NADH dehydrogenase FAD-containing subunit
LGTFDTKLTDYAMSILTSRSEITLKTNTHVKQVKENEVLLSNGEVIPCGITVWSTGKKKDVLGRHRSVPRAHRLLLPPLQARNAH